MATNTVDDPTPVEPVLTSGDTVAFTPAALALVAKLSGGVPRVINLLCDRALEAGYAQQTRTIDAAHLLGVAPALRLNAASANAGVNGRGVAIAVAVASLLVAVAVGIARRPGPAPAAPGEGAIASSVTVSAAVARQVPVTSGLETVRPVMIAVASVREAQPAAKLIGRLTALGLPAFDRAGAADLWHRIVVGPYVSVDEAQADERKITGVGLTNDPIVSAAIRTKRVSSSADGAIARMMALIVADRASLVLELRDAGVEVIPQSADAGTLVLDVGPVTGAITAEAREATATTPCIARVSIQDADRSNQRFVRLRIALRSGCSSRRRIAGRRVYIDFAPQGSNPLARPAAEPHRAEAAAPPPPPGRLERSRPERSAAPIPPAPASDDADVLARARVLAQRPDVRGLIRLRGEVVRQRSRVEQVDPEEVTRLLDALDRYTNEARALQLKIDGRGLRGGLPEGRK